MIRAEILNRFDKEIQKLPTECSKVIKLHCKGLNVKEIALQLNKKERTVRSHISRGYELLKKRFGKFDLLPFLPIFFIFLSNIPY
jgi:RNA polymerase sigma factor (sigma-70 family)